MLSERYKVHLPLDLSGVVVFSKHDYSTLFIQAVLDQHSGLRTVDGTLDFQYMSSNIVRDIHLKQFENELIKNSILVEVN